MNTRPFCRNVISHNVERKGLFLLLWSIVFEKSYLWNAGCFFHYCPSLASRLQKPVELVYCCTTKNHILVTTIETVYEPSRERKLRNCITILRFFWDWWKAKRLQNDGIISIHSLTEPRLLALPNTYSITYTDTFSCVSYFPFREFNCRHVLCVYHHHHSLLLLHPTLVAN